MPDHRIGVVLGAGGPVGFAFHAGVLAALADGGFDARQADLVVGTSIGAVTGALLRAGLSAADLYARACGQPLSAEADAVLAATGGWPVDAAELAAGLADGSAGAARGALGWPPAPRLSRALVRHPRRLTPGLALAAFTRPGRVPVAPIVDAFDSLIGPGWPDRRLWLCAVDADTGGRVVFGHPDGPQAPIGAAVAASSAVPAVFGPVTVGDRSYIDGGLHSPANTDLVAAEVGHLDAVVVSLPMGVSGAPGRRGIDLPGRRSNHRRSVQGLEPLRRAGVPVLLVEPGASELELMHYDTFTFARRDEIAARSRRSTTAALASWEGWPP